MRQLEREIATLRQHLSRMKNRPELADAKTLRTYEEMIAHFKDYNDVVGDNPMNLCTTTLALNAYMLAHEQKYRDWAVGYIDAWVERTKANGGMIPTNGPRRTLCSKQPGVRKRAPAS